MTTLNRYQGWAIPFILLGLKMLKCCLCFSFAVTTMSTFQEHSNCIIIKIRQICKYSAYILVLAITFQPRFTIFVLPTNYVSYRRCITFRFGLNMYILYNVDLNYFQTMANLAQKDDAKVVLVPYHGKRNTKIMVGNAPRESLQNWSSNWS